MQQQKVFKRFITIPPTSAVITVEDSLRKKKKPWSLGSIRVRV